MTLQTVQITKLPADKRGCCLPCGEESLHDIVGVRTSILGFYLLSHQPNLWGKRFTLQQMLVLLVNFTKCIRTIQSDLIINLSHLRQITTFCTDKHAWTKCLRCSRLDDVSHAKHLISWSLILRLYYTITSIHFYTMYYIIIRLWNAQREFNKS